MPKPQVFGKHYQCHLINWMGSQEWPLDEARKVLKALVDDVVGDSTIRQCWNHGREGSADIIAEQVNRELTTAERARLEQLRKHC